MNEPSAMEPADAPIALGYSTQRPRRRWGRIIAVAFVVALGMTAHFTRSQWWPPVQEAGEWHAACEKARTDVRAYRDSLDANEEDARADCDHVLDTLAALDPLRLTRALPGARSVSTERTPLSASSLDHRARAIASMVQLSKKYIDQRRYMDAITVVDAILVLDPRHDYGLGVRPILVDRASLAESRRIPVLRQE